MKHLFGLPLGALMMGLVAVMMSPNSVHASPIALTVTPARLMTSSSIFELAVAVEEVSDLYAFQFNLGFDPTLLAAVSESEGSFLPGGGDTFFLHGAIDNVGGTISFTANTLLTAAAGVSGGGNLALINFQALGQGTSAINIFNAQLLDSSLNGLAFNTTNGTVTVQALPEPGAIILLGLGLTGLVARRWVRIPGIVSTQSGHRDHEFRASRSRIGAARRRR